MAVSIVLTPTTIASADYPIAQRPALGGEKIVYLTTVASRVLGIAFATADGTLSYQYVNRPNVTNTGPILAVALDGGVLQSSAATISFGGLTASFANVGWTSKQTTFNFPVGRAAELTGTFSPPVASSAWTGVVPTVGVSMLAGSKFGLIEMPTLSDFLLAGCTNNRAIKVPARSTKSIACGMNRAEWTTPGMTQEGSLEVTGLQFGVDDGLSRFRGMKCQAMLVTVAESRLTTQRDFCLDWTGETDENYPEGDGEATVVLRGQFSKMATLPAP